MLAMFIIGAIKSFNCNDSPASSDMGMPSELKTEFTLALMCTESDPVEGLIER